MKCALIIQCALIFVTGISEAKWCTQNVTTESRVREVLTRTVLMKSFLGPDRVKSESYSVIKVIPKIKEKRVCCDGYILDTSNRTCNPLCPDGCPNLSDCVEPNFCKCHPGYSMQDGKCRMDCKNCDNGECTELGVCECNANYVRFEDACKPICKRKCANGFCAAPDVCQCNSGYEQHPETKQCEPICDKLCGGNAYCSAPQVCTCKYGYFGNASDVCQPWCKSVCKNGICVGPNTCSCHQGFVKVDGLCLPDCHSGCKFGDCQDEGVCVCWTGFAYNNLTGSCQEGLEIEPTTVSVAIEGGTHCEKGFVKVDESCLSLCKTCKLGDCVAEAKCQRLQEITSTNVKSTSEASITSETSSSESSTIAATSDPTQNCECLNYNCVEGECECIECAVSCEATCKNGVCNENDVCECSAGYVRKNDTECVPQCDWECINSTCIAPNQCECLEGFIGNFSPTSGNSCLPTCNGLVDGCTNGTCVAVNKCRCLDGLVRNPDDRFECIADDKSAKELNNRGDSSRWYLYLLLGLLLLLTLSSIAYLTIRKLQQDSYNVDKVEKSRGNVQYKNSDQPYCVM